MSNRLNNWPFGSGNSFCLKKLWEMLENFDIWSIQINLLKWSLVQSIEKIEIIAYRCFASESLTASKKNKNFRFWMVIFQKNFRIKKKFFSKIFFSKKIWLLFFILFCEKKFQKLKYFLKKIKDLLKNQPNPFKNALTELDS